jgi:hypothetical protein
LRLRFDYLVRSRVLSPGEAARLKGPADGPGYPQREAVLFALRELTGQDPGTSTEAWLRLYPRAETDVRAARLSGELLRANPLRQDYLLARLRDGQDPAATRALADVVRGLKGPMREQAREALVRKLTRLTPSALCDSLRDEDPEIRQAAVRACAREGRKDLVPELIALLEDPEPVTARLAEEGLQDLTRQRFSHPEGWKAWWKDHAPR